MSCRHDLALGTCKECYPETGTIVPTGPGDSLDGPGARPRSSPGSCWCCYHHLITGTCKVCYPATGTVDPQAPVGPTRIETLEQQLADARARATSAWAIVRVTREMTFIGETLSLMISEHQRMWPEDKT